jgi:tetratricopeptide (TPR) repeat protein
LGDEHVVTLDAMLGLSIVYANSGRHQEAESLFARGLETAERALSAEHELTLQFMNSLALLHLSLREVGQSVPLVTRAFEISQRVLGDEHPITIQSMFVRGLTYAFQGQVDEAESMMQESVQLSRRILGDENYWTLFYMRKLAHIYRELGRYEDAGPLFVKVIEGKRRLRGQKHQDTQLSITELCRLYELSGQIDKLKTLFLSNSKMFEKQRAELDEGDTVLVGYLNGHARWQAAYPVAELRNGPEAIENASKACELTNWKTGTYVDTLAAAYAEAGDFASAIEWQKKAMDLLTEEERPLQQPYFEARMKLYESGQPARQSFVRSVAWYFYSRGQYGEAEQWLIKALEFSRRVLGEEHSEIQACQEDFVRLYQAWGKPETAEEWRAKLPRSGETEKETIFDF